MASEVSRERMREQAAKPRWVEDAVASLFAFSSLANPRNTLAPGLPYNCHVPILPPPPCFIFNGKPNKKNTYKGPGYIINILSRSG